jgi:hypothetical protein
MPEFCCITINQLHPDRSDRNIRSDISAFTRQEVHNNSSKYRGFSHIPLSLPYRKRAFVINFILTDNAEHLNLISKTNLLMGYIHRPVSSIDHDVSETGSVSILRWM